MYLRRLFCIVALLALAAPAYAQFVSDTFTDTTGTNLTSHTGETGATWTVHTGISGGTGQCVIEANRSRGETAGVKNVVYASGTPGSADYTIQADMIVKSNGANTFEAGLLGRMTTDGTVTFYQADYSLFSNEWRLYKFVTGTPTALGTYGQTLTDEQTYVLKLEMIGTAIKVYVDGVERISATDSAISAAGKAGFFQLDQMSSSTGFHFDNFTATNGGGGGGPATTPKGTLLGVLP